MGGIRDEIRRIHDTNGGSLPKGCLVAAAKSPKSPLHHCFEWDDRKAGHAYRLVQEADLVRSIRTEYARDAGGPKTIRSYISTYEVGASEPGAYQATEEVMANDLSAAIVLRNFERSLADLKRQYGHLREFSEQLKRAAG